MKKLAYHFMLAASLFTAVACNTKEDSSEKAEDQNEATLQGSMEDDAEFAVEAADGGMYEVQLGELAQRSGTSPQVKEFGKMMATDHGKANEELKTLAQQKNITLPTALSKEKQDKYNDLAKKTGNDFDRAYAELMVSDHREDIEEFREMAEEGMDAELKSWAASKVPALEMHLERAQAMQNAVKK